MSSIKVSAKQMLGSRAVPVARNRERGANSAQAKLEKHRIETAAGKRGQFPAQRKKFQMALHLSHSFPTFRLNFPGNDFNEYRLRQGRVEFCASSGEWRILGEDEVQLHYILHTEVAKWLKTQSANENALDAITGNMPNEKPKDQSESKFAEVIRKGKEKRRGMQQESERRATSAELESLVRGEINDADEPGNA